MSRDGTPPFPHGDWRSWALQLVEFLQDRAQVNSENAPRPILLSHQTDSETERAFTDGIVMYDPEQDEVVASIDGEWVGIGGTGGYVRWMDRWVSGTTYRKNDMVLDNPWTMIANKDTDDRPAPQPQGPEYYLYNGGSPTSDITAKQLTVGVQLINSTPIFLLRYRVYTIVGNTYSVFSSVDDGLVNELISFTADATGWQEFSTTSAIAAPGTKIEMGVRIQEPDPAPTMWTGDWNYQTPNNYVAPVAGEMVHATKNIGIISVSVLDDAGSDRSADLDGLAVGDVIDGAGTRWTIQGITDQGAYMDFTVAPAVQGAPQGVQTFTFETLAAVPIETVVDTDYYTSLLEVSGWYIVDDEPRIDNQTAYGIDMVVQSASVSDDWDLVAMSAGVGGGGGGGSGASNFDELTDTPNSKTTYAQRVPVVTPDEVNLRYLKQGVEDFQTDHTYYKDDIVAHEGVLYHCISVGPVTGAFNPDDWAPAGSPTGSGITLGYDWTTVTAGAPPSGGFGITDPIANPTNTLRISDLTTAGLNAGAFWNSVADGDFIGFIEDSGGAESGVWIASGSAVVQAGYTEIPVILENHIGEPENNRKGFALLVYSPNSRVPPGGITGEVLAKQSNADFDTDWFDLTTTFLQKSGGTMSGTLTLRPGGAQASPVLGFDGTGHGFYSDITILYVTVEGVQSARFYTAGTAAPAAGCIMTREKGDARYTQTLQLQALSDLLVSKGLLTQAEIDTVVASVFNDPPDTE